MKRSKFADKITDYVENTLQNMGYSEDFTVYDNLDDEFSFTLEYDRTGICFNYDLAEIYETKQTEDVKVKDLYRNHVESRIVEFVNRQVERTMGNEADRMRALADTPSLSVEPAETDVRRSLNMGNVYEDDEEEIDEYEDEEEDFREDDDIWREDDDEYEEDEEDDEYLDEEDEPVNVSNETFEIIHANDLLPSFLRSEGMDNCIFVKFSEDLSRDTFYSIDKAYSEISKALSSDKGSDILFAILDDHTIMGVKDMNKDFFKNTVEDLNHLADNLMNTGIYTFENGHAKLYDGSEEEEEKDFD